MEDLIIILLCLVLGLKTLVIDYRDWDKGFVSVGTVTADSCGYVAGYVRKKLTGPMAEEVYNGRVPPFQLQSQGLGIVVNFYLF